MQYYDNRDKKWKPYNYNTPVYIYSTEIKINFNPPKIIVFAYPIKTDINSLIVRKEEDVYGSKAAKFRFTSHYENFEIANDEKKDGEYTWKKCYQDKPSGGDYILTWGSGQWEVNGIKKLNGDKFFAMRLNIKGKGDSWISKSTWRDFMRMRDKEDDSRQFVLIRLYEEFINPEDKLPSLEIDIPFGF